MLFPILKFGRQNKRSRSQPPEIVSPSWQAPLRPLSCQVAAPARPSILLEAPEPLLPDAPPARRRASHLEAPPAHPLPPSPEPADVTYIYPSRGRRGERAERRFSTRLPSAPEDPEDERYLSPRRAPAPAPRQELVLEYARRPSRCRSCSAGPGAPRSVSSQPARSTTRAVSIASAGGPRRRESRARSAATASSGRRSDSPSTDSSARTSPSLTASSKSSRRSSVSTSPSLSAGSTGSFYRYRPYEDSAASTRAYDECVRGRQLDEAEKRRFRRILKVAEYAAGRRGVSR